MPYSLSDYSRFDLACFPTPIGPSAGSPRPQVGYRVRHGNPGMLRRDLVNMRACAAHVSERCPSCMYLSGVPQFLHIALQPKKLYFWHTVHSEL